MFVVFTQPNPNRRYSRARGNDAQFEGGHGERRAGTREVPIPSPAPPALHEPVMLAAFRRRIRRHAAIVLHALGPM